MAERVERFSVPFSGGAWTLKPSPTGSMVRYSDYEKEKTRADELAATDEAQLENRILELEAQRDQARQEVLEEVAVEFERKAEDGEWMGREDITGGDALQWAASHCRSLATLDPSGEDCGLCHGDGEVRNHTGDSVWAICPDCGGTGRKPASHPSGEQGEEARGHDFKLAEQCPVCGQAVPDPEATPHWPDVYVTRRKTASKEIGAPGYFNAYSLSAEPPDWPAFESRRYTPATDTSKEEDATCRCGHPKAKHYDLLSSTSCFRCPCKAFDPSKEVQGDE